MKDIYWKLDVGGFYLLDTLVDGYVFVGRDYHQAVLDDAAENARVIVFDETSGKPVAIDQQIEDQQNVE